MKKASLIFVAIISLILSAQISHGQQAAVGPKIVLEEEEITVFVDDKEVEKYYVSKHGEEKIAIMKDAREKKRKIKVKDVWPPKLNFYDEKGRLVKDLNLSNEKSMGKIKEIRPGYRKGEYEAELTTVKRPVVSRQGKYTVMDNSTFAAIGEAGVAIGKIVLYDAAGSVLFEKQFSHGTGVVDEKLIVSDSGTVAVITSDKEEGPGGEILHAYDKTGKELLVYPKEDEKAAPGSVLKMSSNGKFLAVRVRFEHKYTRTAFFNLENSTSWKADQDYNVYEISDNGIVKADYYDEIKREPSDTVTIDLGARMKP